MIGEDGSQLGILQTRQALQLAREQGLDLVMVAPGAQPPVCRIIDYGKFKYLTEKQGKDKKSKNQEVKGIKISPRIAEHDLAFLVKNAQRFLAEGSKVRVTCQFRSREITHPELGRKKLSHFLELLGDIALVEREPVLDGRLMTMVLNPKPQVGSKKNAKDQNLQDGSKAIQDQRDGEDPAEEVAQQPPVPAQEGLA